MHLEKCCKAFCLLLLSAAGMLFPMASMFWCPFSPTWVVVFRLVDCPSFHPRIFFFFLRDGCSFFSFHLCPWCLLSVPSLSLSVFPFFFVSVSFSLYLLLQLCLLPFICHLSTSQCSSSVIFSSVIKCWLSHLSILSLPSFPSSYCCLSLFFPPPLSTDYCRCIHCRLSRLSLFSIRFVVAPFFLSVSFSYSTDLVTAAVLYVPELPQPASQPLLWGAKVFLSLLFIQTSIRSFR